MSNSNPTRWLKPKECLDGSQEWRSITHAANIGGEIHVKPHLPGIIIFVHGVNSEGEWYDDAERELCAGLNERLNLTNTDYQLKQNEYYEPKFILDEKNYDNSHYIYEEPIRTLKKLGNSPVIRFYWGYRATDDDLGQYCIPLKNKEGESYHRLVNEMLNPEYSDEENGIPTLDDIDKLDFIEKYNSLPSREKKAFIHENIKHKGPFFWGGGPFQNGCNNLVSLWSEHGFSNLAMLWTVIPTPIPFNVQAFNPESDRLLTKSPPRHYYAHAVKRLANLVKKIRENNPYDTVTVISHSQGTMIALAAAAIEAPDSLFVLNSPYATKDNFLNSYSYVYNENINEAHREATLKEIIDKIAKNKNRLKGSPCGYSSLVVGESEDKKSWTPDVIIYKGNKLDIRDNENKENKKNIEINKEKFTKGEFIKERDNHGRFYIYCNPHDRVMGSSPLESIGWCPLPNTEERGQIQHHPLFALEHPPYIRMLARNTPCGGKPNPKTIFTDANRLFSDGNIFWDSNTKTLEGFAWPEPSANISLNINAPEVPHPITPAELATFDEDFAVIEKKEEKPAPEINIDADNQKKEIPLGQGYGQILYDDELGIYTPKDAEYYFYKDLYSYQHRIWVELTPEEKKVLKNNPLLDPQDQNATTKYETLEEMKKRIREYNQRPTDHGTLPRNSLFLRRVVTYDLPIGYCEIGRSPEKMDELRKYADWLSGLDIYMEKGELDLPEMPDIIKNPLKKK
ncbi:T6SS effector phospholipase Tle3 domain-containing protein [Proteus terrae]